MAEYLLELGLEEIPSRFIDDLSQQAMNMYDNGEISLNPDDTQSVHLHVKNDFER